LIAWIALWFLKKLIDAEAIQAKKSSVKNCVPCMWIPEGKVYSAVGIRKRKNWWLVDLQLQLKHEEDRPSKTRLLNSPCSFDTHTLG
jgi:hypothetical protein